MGIAVGSVYLATVAPALTFSHCGADGGDLIAAARNLGIPHPTGYPAYVLLAWLFTKLPVGTLAFRVNLLSAVCAAFAASILCRIVQLQLRARRHVLLLSAAAAMTAAFCPLLWSQSVISEVYTLLALFSAVVVWLLLRYRNSRRDHTLWLAAFVFGLGLGSHLTLVLLAPASLALLLPNHLARLRPRNMLITFGAFFLGLTVYVYIPVAASQHPFINWGDPRTWDRFFWLVTGSQYQALAFGLQPAEMLGRAASWARLIGEQFGWWGLAIALAGTRHMWTRDIQLGRFSVLWVLSVLAFAFFYDSSDSMVYLIPVFITMSMWWYEGARYLLKVLERQPVAWRELALISVSVLPLLSLTMNWQAVTLKDDWAAHLDIVETLESASKDSLIVVQGDVPTFGLWYASHAEGRREDVTIVNGPLLTQAWYRAHIREIYPSLALPEPLSSDATSDELVRDLITANYATRAVYATDPSEAWRAWFDFVQEGRTRLFGVRIRTLWRPAG